MANLAARVREWLRRLPAYRRWRESRPRRWLGMGLGLLRNFLQKYRLSLQIPLILVYRLALDVLYRKVIVPEFAYSGFTVNFHPLFYACTLMALLAFSPAVARLQEEGTPSANIVTFISYVYFIPLTSYCGCNWQGMFFFLTGLAYWAILLALQLSIPVLAFRPLGGRSSRWLYLLLTALVSGLVMYVSGRYAGFRLTFDVLNVYDIRSEAAGYDLPHLVDYGISMAGNVLTVLLVYWLTRRKYVICAALLAVYMFFFSIAAHKTLFFFLVVVVAGYFLFRPWMRQWLPALTTAAAAAGVLEHRLLHTFYLAGVFIRREMYLPVSLSENYMAYFQDNPLMLFRDNILRRFSFPSVYSARVENIIGGVNGNVETYANNGLLGDLFANLPPLLGLALMPLILVLCFRLLDATARSVPEKIALPICVYFAVTFTNSPWSVVLLSHGFLITCLLLYIFPKEEGLSQ